MHWDLNVAKFQGDRIIFTYVLRSDSNVVACNTYRNNIYSDRSGIGLVIEHDLLFLHGSINVDSSNYIKPRHGNPSFFKHSTT